MKRKVFKFLHEIWHEFLVTVIMMKEQFPNIGANDVPLEKMELMLDLQMGLELVQKYMVYF